MKSPDADQTVNLTTIQQTEGNVERLRNDRKRCDGETLAARDAWSLLWICR